MKKKLKLPSLMQLEDLRIPKHIKRDALGYANYRVKQLKLAWTETNKDPNFNSYTDFLYGRLIEAEQIRDFIKYLKSRS